MNTVDTYKKLHEVVTMLDERFPDGTNIFQRVSRLAEETGELASAVNHIEGMGIKTQKYGQPDKEHLVKEIQDVMRAALGIAHYYRVEAELDQSIHEAHERLIKKTF